MFYILTPINPQGYVHRSVKCEQPLDEVSIQVWLLRHHLNFQALHFLFKRDEIMDKLMETRGPGALYRAQEYRCNLVLFFF